MIADWVAASVRARGMVQRRMGQGGCDRLAACHDFDSAAALLEGSVYGDRLSGVSTLGEAQRAVNESVLWQFRVLAGWMPASGTQLVAAAVAGFEAHNIVALSQGLSGRAESPAPYELGALATAWPTVRTATSLTDLSIALRESRWGDVGTLSDPDDLADILTAAWLQRLMTVAPAARPWVVRAFVLIASRILVVDHTTPSARFLQIVRPSIADSWPSAHDLTGVAAALPRSARTVLDGVESPTDLWRAEMRLVDTVETDAGRLLRGALPGADVILGAIALLAVDAWRVCAALATAAADAGGSLDDVA
ncbi:MAG: V-type ATPase subunit [Lacisediminihabitans sp.]